MIARGGCDNPDCATERQMLGCAQRDMIELVHANTALRAENEKLKRQFNQLAELTKRAMVMLEQALGR